MRTQKSLRCYNKANFATSWGYEVWRDVDFDSESILVSRTLYKRRRIYEFKEPKTAHSRRRVNMTPKLADYLKEYKA